MRDGLCGCGKPGRYATIGQEGEEVWACNKYRRCLTYEELSDQYTQLKRGYFELLVAGEDLCLYREGTENYKQAESLLRKHLDKYTY